MASPASPQDTRAIILERLLGERGETGHIIEAARAMGVRALPLLADGLNSKLASPLLIDLKSVEVARMPDAKPAEANRHAMTIASSPLSSDALIMIIDPDAVAVLVSALFGGDPALPVVPIDRSFSPTEIEVAGIAFQEAAASVNGWGARALDIRFPLPLGITGDDLKRKVLRDGPAVRLVFTLSLGDSTGCLNLLMPQRLLMHRAGAGGQGSMPETDWRTQLNAEVMRSTVTLEAMLPLGRMTLGEIASLRTGQVIALQPTAQSETRLSTRDKTLFICEFGKLGQNYTVRVRHPFDAGQDLIDGLMPRRT
jgi:flagellar motor switch protein FliM